MRIQKIIGFLLLAIGLMVIFYSLFTSYKIFYGKSPAPQIFKIEEEKDLTQKTATGQKKTTDPQTQLEEILQKNIQSQLQEILPAGFLPKILNLFAWSIFAGILIFGGTQISSLGIKLIKK